MHRHLHIAIVLPEYLSAIVEGRKSVESRLSRVRCAPFGVVQPGEVVFFRRLGGDYGARARVADVLTLDNLSAHGVRSLHRRFNHLILASDDYWNRRAQARFATLIWLEHIEPVRRGPAIGPLYGAGWKTIGAADARPRPVNPPRPSGRLLAGPCAR